MLTPVAKQAFRRHCLDVSKQEFDAGDKLALLRALFIVASSREPMPEWMIEPLYRVDKGLGRGELADLNEAFGWTQKGEFSKRNRKEHYRKQQVANEIFIALFDARRQGKGMTPDTFEEVAEGFAHLKVGRAMVQGIWKERQSELMKVKPGDPKGGFAFGFVDYW